LANRVTRVRIARRPRRPVIVFRFRGRVFSLARRRASRSGGQRGHYFSASSAVRSAYAVWNRVAGGSNPPSPTLFAWSANGRPPDSESGWWWFESIPGNLFSHVRVAKRPKVLSNACKALNSSVRLRSRTPFFAWCPPDHPACLASSVAERSSVEREVSGSFPLRGALSLPRPVSPAGHDARPSNGKPRVRLPHRPPRSSPAALHTSDRTLGG